MLPTQRSSLISRGMGMIQAFHPATITFTGHPPMLAGRRTGSATGLSVLGGTELSTPETFIVVAADLPAGVTITPATTTFVCDELNWLVDIVTPQQPGEPQIRFTANLAAR